jgi:hypothetical protein
VQGLVNQWDGELFSLPSAPEMIAPSRRCDVVPYPDGYQFSPRPTHLNSAAVHQCTKNIGDFVAGVDLERSEKNFDQVKPAEIPDYRWHQFF